VPKIAGRNEEPRGPEVTTPAGVKGVRRAGNPVICFTPANPANSGKTSRAASLVVVSRPEDHLRQLHQLLQAFLRPAHPFGVRTRTPPMNSSILVFHFKACYDSPSGPGPGLYPVTSPVSDTPCHGRPPPLHPRSRLRVHGSRQFILSGPRAGEPARLPSAAPMRITLPCSTGHLPLQTARAHGPHFQMGSLRPR
jgi:hypothetical protein